MPEIDGVKPIPICAKVEAELAELEPGRGRRVPRVDGLAEPGLNTLIREAYRLLGLQSYFTAGEKEVRAWTVPIGAKAPQAAGVIHTDFERGFIKAEVVGYEDYVALGGEKGARDGGQAAPRGQGVRRARRRRHALPVQRVAELLSRSALRSIVLDAPRHERASSRTTSYSASCGSAVR